jgi:uncharacterized ferritin-like protein (DUF455 family)
MVFNTSPVRQKLEELDSAIARAFQSPMTQFPLTPARDVPILVPGLLPPKKGLSFKEGQARLLHDLASIELQAMELGLRTLHEYPEAPFAFREELASVVKSEGQHLRLCLEGIEKLGFKWGDWPAHTMLWGAVDKRDSLLDRILIVHRYLEGSGLDAGETLLRRLDAVLETPLHKISKIIIEEEIGHVEFGSRWYREICRMEKIEPEDDFAPRLESFRYRIPKRIEKISRKFRTQAGFTHQEIDFLEDLRSRMAKFG